MRKHDVLRPAGSRQGKSVSSSWCSPSIGVAPNAGFCAGVAHQPVHLVHPVSGPAHYSGKYLKDGVCDFRDSTNNYDDGRYAAVIAAGARRSLAAIFTRSARESAFIFCITLPRCAFTVISLIPSSPATCLFNRPETTNNITCLSRCDSDA